MFGKTDGIDPWRHYLRVDKRQPHPFKQDALGPDGTYRLGRPSFFDVVDDDQLIAPRDDRGLKTHREQVLAWRWRPVQMSASGLQAEQPVKANEDTVDSTRFITATWGTNPAPLSLEERIEQRLPAELRQDALAQRDPLFVDGRHFGRLMARAELERELDDERGDWAKFWESTY